MQLNKKNENMKIMIDFEKKETITLKEILPFCWGKERYENTKSVNDLN